MVCLPVSSGPTAVLANAGNTILIPDRGEVTVLKLDDQLRLGLNV